jgi:DNA (cytosine-5)-methyltransferase 1
MNVYYNENNPEAAEWLRQLMQLGQIPEGDVDERSIVDVRPEDLKQYKQCHFFAGIGVWAYASEQAGWGGAPVWTGSCPCQPFSSAGNKKGTQDERHLWPVWYELIRECNPEVVFGEQVASADVVGKVKGDDREVWIDVVQTDLERASYTTATFDLPAAGFGAPHLRQRCWFVADAINSRSQGHWEFREKPISQGWQRAQRHGSSGGIGLGNSTSQRCREERAGQPGSEKRTAWSDCDWLNFKDGKQRCVESGTFPLVDGTPTRVGQSSDLSSQAIANTKEASKMRLQGYGNAIVAPAAQAFIEAYIQCR